MRSPGSLSASPSSSRLFRQSHSNSRSLSKFHLDSAKLPDSTSTVSGLDTKSLNLGSDDDKLLILVGLEVELKKSSYLKGDVIAKGDVKVSIIIGEEIIG